MAKPWADPCRQGDWSLAGKRLDPAPRRPPPPTPTLCVVSKLVDVEAVLALRQLSDGARDLDLPVSLYPERSTSLRPCPEGGGH